MLNEYEIVEAIEDIEERDITIMKGSKGTIVHINRFIPGYMVEFKDGVVVSVWPHEVRKVVDTPYGRHDMVYHQMRRDLHVCQTGVSA